LKILLVDDEKLSRNMMAKYITGLLGYDVTQCEDGGEAIKLFKEEYFDLVISDIKMPTANGLEVLKEIKKSPKGDDVAIILITGFAEVETAVEALREGAYDYLYKPVDVNRLTELIKKRADEIKLAQESSLLLSKAKDTLNDEDLQGDISAKYNKNILDNGAYFTLPDGERIGMFSKELKEVFSMAMILHDDRSIPSLIEGESGTGKEVIAKIIHYGAEKDSKRPLVSINCSAISPSLFESELFGYEGHTFTGAKESGMIGKLEMANGGTIFLDEVGDMPLEMQPKLLRVLQDRQLYKIGAQKPIQLDIRVIAATNRGLEKLVAEGKFRGDLYHRLKIGWISIPALREQKASLASIAQMFLVETAQKRNKQFRFISKDAVKILSDYEWSGNIRELKNIIERIVLLYDEIELRPEHLTILKSNSQFSFDDGLPTLTPGAFKLPEKELNIHELELEIVQLALEKFNGNKSKTAQYLGLTLSALRSRLP
jgi:DNA-binding NtrC family response regulator